MEIRRASAADIDSMVALGHQFLEECDIALPELHEGMVADLLPKLFGMPDDFLAVLAADGDDVFGVLVAEIGRFLFSPDKIGRHDMLYVRLDKRGGTAGLRLIRAYEDWARAMGAAHITLAVHSGIDPDRTGKLYSKLGYQYQGGNYILEVV